MYSQLDLNVLITSLAGDIEFHPGTQIVIQRGAEELWILVVSMPGEGEVMMIQGNSLFLL